MKKLLTSIITLLMLTTCFGFNVMAETEEGLESSEILLSEEENEGGENLSGNEVIQQDIIETSETASTKIPVNATFEFTYEENPFSLDSDIIRNDETGEIDIIAMHDAYKVFFDNDESVNDLDKYIESLKLGKVCLYFEDNSTVLLPVDVETYSNGFEYLGTSYSYVVNDETYSFDIIVDDSRICSKKLDVTYQSGNVSGGFELFAQLGDYKVDEVAHPFDAYDIVISEYVDFNNIQLTINKSEGQEDLELVKDDNILLPFGFEGSLEKYSGYKCEHDGRTSYFLVRALPMVDLGVVLYSAGNEYSFEYSYKDENGVDIYWIAGEPEGIDYNDLSARDKNGNELLIDRNYTDGEGSFIVAKTVDGKSVFMISVNQKEAYIEYGKQSNRIDFHFMGDVDGFKYYELSRIGNFDISNVSKIIYDGREYSVTEVTEVLYGGNRYKAVKVDNVYFMLEFAVPEVTVVYTDENDKQYTYRFALAWDDEKYIVYYLDSRDYYPGDLNSEGFSKAYIDGLESEYKIEANAFEYNGVSFDGFVCSIDGFNRKFVFYKHYAPLYPIKAYLEYDGKSYNYSYIETDFAENRDNYWPQANTNSFSDNGEFKIHIIDGDNDIVVKPSYDEKSQTICYKGYVESIGRNVTLYVKDLRNNQSGTYDIVMNYRKVQNGNSEDVQMRFDYRYDSPEGIPVYNVDFSLLNSMFRMENVQSIQYLHDGVYEELPIEKHLIDGSLQYVAVIREGDVVKAYCNIYSASIFDKVVLEIFDDEIPLAFTNRGNGVMVWSVFTDGFSAARISRYNYFRENFTTADFEIKYYKNWDDSEPWLVQTAADTVYNNANNVHGYKIGYFAEEEIDGINYAEEGLYALSGNSNEVFPEYSSITSAYFDYQGVRYYFDVNNPVLDSNGAKYNLINESGTDFSPLIIKNGVPGTITVEYKTVKGRSGKTQINFYDTSLNQNERILGTSLYTTKNGNHDYKLTFKIMDIANDIEDGSVINIDEFKYNSFYDYGNNHYRWLVYVDPFVMNDSENVRVKVVNIAPDGMKLTLVESENAPKLVESTDDYLVFEIKKYQDNLITFNAVDENGNSTGISQTHNIFLTTDYTDALKYTFINSIEAVDYRTSINYMYMDRPNSDLKTFDGIHFSAHIQSADLYDRLLSSIEKEDFAAASVIEDKIFRFVFKTNVKVSREYYLADSANNSSRPLIVYTLSLNGKTQKVYIEVNKQGGYGSGVIIDGKQGFSTVVYADNPNTGKCEEFFIYASNVSSISSDKILEMTDYRYHQLYVDVYNEYLNNNPEYNDKLLYKDGKVYKLSSIVHNNIYDVSDVGIEFVYGGAPKSYTLEKARKIALDTYNEYEFNLRGFSDYEEAKNELSNFFKNGPIAGIKNAEGDFVPVEKCFDTYEELKEYEGDEPAYTIYVKTVKNDSMSYQIKLLVKQKGINDLALLQTFHPSTDGSEPDNLSYEVSSEEMLLSIIDSVKGYRNVTIRLTDNISLSSDLRIYHPLETLCIDLNGKNINAGANSIEIIQGSSVNFINSSQSNSTMSSTAEDCFINNYGELKINENQGDSTTVLGKLTISSASTAVNSSWNSSLRVYKNVEINGSTCIKLVSDAAGTTRVDFSIWGEDGNRVKLNAKDAAIYVDTVAATDYGSRYLNLSYVDIVSDNVGIYSKGDFELRIMSCSVDAKSPLIIGGVEADIKYTGINSSSANYSENYLYDKCYGEFGFSTNGVAILVDSADPRVGRTTVSIGEIGSKIKAKGSLVAESGNIAKIDLVEISDNTYYSFRIEGDNPVLDFGATDYESRIIEFNGELIDIVDPTVINVYGGLFNLDVSGFEYVDTDATQVYDAHIWDFNGDTGKTVCYVKAQENNATVNNYAELKAALESKAINYIYINSSITYNSLNDGDSNELNVFAGRSGKYIYLAQGVTVSGYQFNCNGPLKEDASNYNVRIYNGSFSNNGPVFVVDGCNFNVQQSSITSNDRAIVLEKGSIFIQDTNVTAPRAIVSNAESADDYARIVVSGGRISGTAGPAIDLKNSSTKELFIQLQRNWADVSEVAEIVSNSDSAIKVDGLVNIWLYGSQITGKKGIEISSAAGSRVYAEGDNKIVAAEGEAVSMTDCSNSTLTLYGAEMVAAADTVKFYGTGYYELNGVKLKKGVGKLYVNTDVSHYNGSIQSGYFSDVVSTKEIGYLNNSDAYIYKSILTNVYEDYPYSIVATQKSAEENKGISYTNVVLGNSRSVKVETNDAISAAEAYAYKVNNDGKEMEMVLNVSQKDSTFSEEFDVKESFEISVTKNGNETTELVNYQTVTMSISDYTKVNNDGVEENVYSDPEKLVVYHNHDGNVYALKKVSEADGKLLQEECYYITYDENNVAYVNIVTRQFSEFGLAEASRPVPESQLKSNATLNLAYDNTYTLSDFSQPAYAEVNGYKLLSGEATVVYEGIEGTVFYSENELPTIGGNFKVTWYAKDNNSLGISGSGSTIINIVNNNSSNISDSECQVYGNSISLDGDIAKNFYILIDEDIMLDSGAYAELSDGKYSIRQNIVDNSEAVNIDGNNVTVGKFTYRVPAKEIYKPITIRLYSADGKLIKLSHTVNGYTKDVTAGYTSSVGEYLNAMLEKADISEELYNVCSRMVEYGELAAEYFGGERAEISGDVLSVKTEELEAYKAVEASSPYVTEHAVSLVLESETTIKHYFRFDLGEYENFDIKVNGKSVVVEQRNDDYGTYYVISIPNISAKNLDETYVVELTHEDGTVLKYEYSALSYVYAQLSNPRDNLLRNLCASIYLYNQAANSYFEMNQR